MANPVPVAQVHASSYYRSSGNVSDTFHPARLIEGRKDFGGWISDVGQVENAWIEFRFVKPARLAAVEIVNGLIEEGPNKTRDDYYFHMRAREAVLTFPDSGAPDVALTLADSKAPQVHPLDPGWPVAAVRMTINSVYRDSPDGTIKSFNVVGLRAVEWRGEAA
jgi:hypothetical protein